MASKESKVEEQKEASLCRLNNNHIPSKYSHFSIYFTFSFAYIVQSHDRVYVSHETRTGSSILVHINIMHPRKVKTIECICPIVIFLPGLMADG